MFLKHTKWALLWALMILVLCAVPGRDLPKVSFLELLNFDKFVHATLFFVLILLTSRGFKKQNQYNYLNKFYKQVAFAICITYGGLLELAQGWFFIERSADVFDFIANSFGSTVGLLLFNTYEKLVFSTIRSN